jgi:hypothetical protein
MRWKPLGHLLPILAVLGLVLGPVAGVVGTVPAQAAKTMSAAMSADMPCPHKAPNGDKPCCADMIACAMPCGQLVGMPGKAEVAQMPFGMASLIVPANDDGPVGLPPSPPIRPPRA